jgi:hypothetical protein
MAAEKGGLSTLAEGIGSILAQFGQFFHIFDLSFFVSGATAFAALILGHHLSGYEFPGQVPPWFDIAVIVLGSYVFGVVTFATGRLLRNSSQSRTSLEKWLPQVITDFGLESELTKRLTGRGDRAAAYRLYSWMWADLRDHDSSSESYRLLNRYWVTAAMYDGLVVAFLVWAGLAIFCALGFGGHFSWQRSALFFATAALFCAASRVCYREADRNFEYQVVELSATLAAKKERIVSPEVPPFP